MKLCLCHVGGINWTDVEPYGRSSSCDRGQLVIIVSMRRVERMAKRGNVDFAAFMAKNVLLIDLILGFQPRHILVEIFRGLLLTFLLYDRSPLATIRSESSFLRHRPLLSATLGLVTPLAQLGPAGFPPLPHEPWGDREITHQG